MWEEALGKPDASSLGDMCFYDLMSCQRNAKRTELGQIIRVLVEAEKVSDGEEYLNRRGGDIVVDEIKQIPIVHVRMVQRCQINEHINGITI